jgi:hypothetical protein
MVDKYIIPQYIEHMITDADIKKLKAVFATKNDLIVMEKSLKREIVESVVDYLQENILPILNEHDKRLDRLEKRVGGFPALA